MERVMPYSDGSYEGQLSTFLKREMLSKLGSNAPVLSKLLLDYVLEQPAADAAEWTALFESSIKHLYLTEDTFMSSDDYLQRLEQREGTLKFCIWSLFIRYGTEEDSAKYLQFLTSWLQENMLLASQSDLEGALRCLTILPKLQHRALKRRFWHQAIDAISSKSSEGIICTLGDLTGDLLDEMETLEPLWRAVDRCGDDGRRTKLLRNAIYADPNQLTVVPRHQFSAITSDAYRFIQRQTFALRHTLLQQMRDRLPPHMLEVFFGPLLWSHNVCEISVRLWTQRKIIHSLPLRPMLQLCDFNEFGTDSLEYLFACDAGDYMATFDWPDLLRSLAKHLRLESRLGAQKVAQILFEQHCTHMNSFANSNILGLLVFDEWQRKLFIDFYESQNLMCTIGGVRILSGFRESEQERVAVLRDQICQKLGIKFDENVTRYEATDGAWAKRELAKMLEDLCGVSVKFGK
jgi:hypothetical protein